jgi:hypothetical protein
VHDFIFRSYWIHLVLGFALSLSTLLPWVTMTANGLSYTSSGSSGLAGLLTFLLGLVAAGAGVLLGHPAWPTAQRIPESLGEHGWSIVIVAASTLALGIILGVLTSLGWPSARPDASADWGLVVSGLAALVGAAFGVAELSGRIGRKRAERWE